PSLREQLRESPDELPALIRFIAARVAGDEEAEELARESQHWIDSNLGSDYDWPGNVRELEQCVRNIMIRGEYHPHHASSRAVPAEVADAIVEGSLSAEDMLRRYCTLVYAKTGSYQETARRLGLDRRTVRQKIEPGLLDRLRNADGDDSGRRGPAGGL
ncbi:MAG TPA: hypothetical protein VFO18_01980, partial [Methylomirabilota bacterium]|nr:hypothetical protein [Methylomirabilota bacterium]